MKVALRFSKGLAFVIKTFVVSFCTAPCNPLVYPEMGHFTVLYAPAPVLPLVKVIYILKTKFAIVK